MTFQKGYKITEQHRKNLSLSHIGFKVSEETKKKLRGKKLSEEHRKKLIIALTGRPASKQTREKMRLSQLGKHHSEESKRKMGIAKRNMSDETKAKMRANNLGKHLSEETKRKIGEANKGDKCYFWKGGITPENLMIRTHTVYLLWRKACMERDNFTCQKTGIRGGRLQVHHINNFAEFPELRTSIENGITLSEKAHKEFHHIYGIKNNTREQLVEFLNNKVI